ncbi:MAG: SynChlorMet cassette radical SAM/SPASM protein ScmE [Desulfobacterales bacterium]|nr:SynChlorMet cassette radical SAM/SPASM protein ScmE [Desulfobacterales bacterium]
MKTPRAVDIAITHRCNLRCQYCSHFSGPGDSGRDLPVAEWLTFFEELGRGAVFHVTLQGGEPFYREDLEEIVRGIVRNRMRFNILSNGTLITREKAIFLADTGRCDGVQVSIDGSEPITHDTFRGAGTFHRAVRGVEFLQAQAVPVSVRVTIHRQNVHHLESIARFLLEEIGLDGFSTNAASPMGLCRQNRDLIQLTPSERSAAMQSLLVLSRKYPGRISAAAGPLAEARMWRAMVTAADRNAAAFSDCGCLSACSGPHCKLAIRADGVMVPCVQMSHIDLGRIKRDSLADTWQSHPELIRLRRRKGTLLDAFEFCQGCRYRNYCTGNCPALAYLITGKDNHPSPDACLKRFEEAGGVLPDIGEL